LTGPVDTSQEQPLDPDTYRHQLRLLKFLHCGRPVLYQGLKQLVRCLSANQSGSDVQMTVYLAGMPAGIDSTEIQISSNPPNDSNKGKS
jgi:hypothetical protein